MTRDHAQIEELLAVRALGGLDGDDVETLERELASHGDCAECRELEAGFDETAGRLAFALEPEPADAAIADRILAHAPTEVRATDDLAPDRERRSGRAWYALVGIAAAFALVAGFVAFASRSTGIDDLGSAQTIVRFDGEGELAMAYVPGQSGAALIGRGMPDPGPGNVFEIWMIDGETPISGGCVSPRDGAFATFVDADVSGADLMALTIEPESCPAAPTSAPISTAPLPAF